MESCLIAVFLVHSTRWRFNQRHLLIIDFSSNYRSEMSDNETDAQKVDETVEKADKTALTELQAEVSRIGNQLDTLIQKLSLQEPGNHPGQELPNQAVHAQHRAVCTKNHVQGASGTSGDSADAVIQEFEGLKRSLERIRIDSKLTFVRDRTGIRKDDQRQYNVIGKCATFAETIIKLIQTVPPSEVTEELLDQVFLCAMAQLSYLREEASNLYIKSEFGPRVSRMMRGVQRHAPLTAEKVDTLSAVVQLASAQEASRPDRDRDRNRRQWSQWQGRRGQFSNNSYSKYTNRSVPNKRPETWNNNYSQSQQDED